MNIEELEAENKKLQSKLKLYEQALKQDSFIRQKYSQTLETLKQKEKELEYINKNLEKLIHEETAKNLKNEKLILQHKRSSAMLEMLHNVAHHWRQPLSVISTIASGLALKKEYGMLEDEAFFDDLHLIVQKTQQLSHIIEDFGGLLRVSENKSNFTATNIITKSLIFVEASILESEIKIVTQINQDTNLFTYENKLLQAIVNILNNAIDALKNQHIENKLILISCDILEDNVVFEICDNANGIPDEIAENLFDPYFTTVKSNK